MANRSVGVSVPTHPRCALLWSAPFGGTITHHPTQWYVDWYGKTIGRLGTIKITGIHFIGMYLIGVSLTGLHLL